MNYLEAIKKAKEMAKDRGRHTVVIQSEKQGEYDYLFVSSMYTPPKEILLLISPSGETHAINGEVPA